MDQVTVIIVAYNSADVLPAALRSLEAQAGVSSVVVVDNCSTDDTCDMLRRDFPAVTLIENPRNEGFGRANNLALKRASTPYALLLNPDATLAPGALQALVDAASCYTDAAILAPQLYDSNGDIQHTHKRNIFIREKGRDRYTPPSGDVCAEFVSGAVMLFNMEHMRKVGFFDPNIFLYYEDDDICLQARRKGLGVVLVAGAKAVHLVGASSSPHRDSRKQAATDFFKQQQLVWSRLYIEEKYQGKERAGKLAAKLHAVYALKAGFYCVRLDWKKLNRYRGRLAGVHAFSVRPKPL